MVTTFLPAFLLSGFMIPIANMPQAIQVITYIVPARYYIDILVGVYLRDTGLHHAWPSLAVLCVFFIVLSFFNYRLLKKEGL